MTPLEFKNKKQIYCNCKKSKCLKLYCDCFNSGLICGKDCNCQDCANDLYSFERKSAVIEQLEKNPKAFQSKVLVLK